MRQHRFRPSHHVSSDRGIALVVAVLVMAVILVLGLMMLDLSVNENLASARVAQTTQAFLAAEAGLQEAFYRMRLDPTTFSNEGSTACSSTADPVVVGQQGTPAPAWADPTGPSFWKYTPPTCIWSYGGTSSVGSGNYWGGTAANLDSAGRIFTSSGTAHATGGALVAAALSNSASYTVTIAPVVGYVGGCWQYVSSTGTALGSCASVAANPIFKITSIGAAGTAQKTITAMIQRYDVKPTLDGTVTANTNINVQSAAAVIDGHNFDCNGNNPSDSGAVKAATAPTGAAGITIKKDNNLQCPAGTGVASCGGTSTAFPDTIGALLLGPSASQSQIDALNVYLDSIKIDPVVHPEKLPTSAFHGILYVDGGYTQPPDGSTGVLIVHHRNANGQGGCTNPGGCDVANLGNFNGGTFKGLIVADRIDKINGNAQIIGGIIGFGNAADGVLVEDVNGTPNIKYSQCIMAGLPQSFPFHLLPGTWHEE
jgi:hypothetical protein